MQDECSSPRFTASVGDDLAHPRSDSSPEQSEFSSSGAPTMARCGRIDAKLAAGKIGRGPTEAGGGEESAGGVQVGNAEN